MQTILLRVIYVDNTYNNRDFSSFLLLLKWYLSPTKNSVNVIYNNFLGILYNIIFHFWQILFNIRNSTLMTIVVFPLCNQLLRSAIFLLLRVLSRIKKRRVKKLLKLTNSFFLIAPGLLLRGKNLVGQQREIPLVSRKSSRVNLPSLAKGLHQLSHRAAEVITRG